MEQSAAAELSERGVYWARYTKGGRPIAYAVDSHGDVVRRLVVLRNAHAEAAVESLWNYLDLVDPKPMLQLVRTRALPSTERRATLEPVDPYNLPPIPGTWRHRG